MNGLYNNWDVPPSNSPESSNEGPGGPNQGPSSINWWHSPPFPFQWLVPIIVPLILICLFFFFFILAPASSAFSRKSLEISQVMVNQMFLHPDSLLSTDPPTLDSLTH